MNTTPLELENIYDLAYKALSAHGCDHFNADSVATTVSHAERDGSVSHGLFRIPGYVASLKSKKVNGASRPSNTYLTQEKENESKPRNGKGNLVQKAVEVQDCPLCADTNRHCHVSLDEGSRPRSAFLAKALESKVCGLCRGLPAGPWPSPQGPSSGLTQFGPKQTHQTPVHIKFDDFCAFSLCFSVFQLHISVPKKQKLGWKPTNLC